jgi:tetratricopeptide (TPR) repeat protein
MDWKAAGKFFTAAAACRSSRAQNHPWYGAFLMATGRAEEALELAAAVASSPSDSAWPMLIYAAFLYAARRFDSAGRVILESRGIVSETWVSHVLFSLLTLRPERGGIPPPFLGMSIGQNLPDGTAIYTALSLAENLKRLPEDSPEYAALRSLLRAWIEEKERAYIEPFDDEEPPQFRIQRVSPFNLAIGYMTLGEHARAIELLGVDLERGHPLMAWLHLWPIFDPLRQLPEFKRLILKMKLPKTAARLSQKFHSHR